MTELTGVSHSTGNIALPRLFSGLQGPLLSGKGEGMRLGKKRREGINRNLQRLQHRGCSLPSQCLGGSSPMKTAVCVGASPINGNWTKDSCYFDSIPVHD